MPNNKQYKILKSGQVVDFYAAVKWLEENNIYSIPQYYLDTCGADDLLPCIDNEELYSMYFDWVEYLLQLNNFAGIVAL